MILVTIEDLQFVLEPLEFGIGFDKFTGEDGFFGALFDFHVLQILQELVRFLWMESALVNVNKNTIGTGNKKLLKISICFILFHSQSAEISLFINKDNKFWLFYL